VYDCGGKQVLKSRELVNGNTFGKVLETVKMCAGSDAVASAIEQTFRSQIAKGGSTAARAIKTNRILKEGLSKLGVYLTVVDFASYTAELTSSGAIGDVTISVFGTGTPQSLGGWTATCTNADADSSALYKNLATQDAFFNHQGEDLWRLPAWQPSAVQAVKPLIRCTAIQREAVAHDVETTWGDLKSAAVVASEIRALNPPASTTASQGSAPAAKCVGNQQLYDASGTVVEDQITPMCTANRRGAVFQADMEHPFLIAKWDGTRWMLVWMINTAPKCIGIDDLIPGVTAAELSKLMYGFCDGIR